MASHALHFTGLPPGTHTDFRNRRGGDIRIDPGDWVLMDDEFNPAWKGYVDRGQATLADRIPDGVEYLDENSRSKPRRLPPWPPSTIERGALSLLSGPKRLFDFRGDGKPKETSIDVLSVAQLESVRETLMPMELPGFRVVDGRLDRRRGREAHTLPPPHDRNFPVLIRIAWLMCRKKAAAQRLKTLEDWHQYQEQLRALDLPDERPDVPGGKALRTKTERAAGRLLNRWGVIRKPRLPDRVTLYRMLVNRRMEVAHIDLFIMLALADLEENPPACEGPCQLQVWVIPESAHQDPTQPARSTPVRLVVGHPPGAGSTLVAS